MDSQTPDIKEKILFTSPAEACHLMGSNMRGLSQEEADKRLEQYGKNELAQKKQTSMLKKFLANFTSLMALLLWAGGVMAILSGALELGIAIFCVNPVSYTHLDQRNTPGYFVQQHHCQTLSRSQYLYPIYRNKACSHGHQQ